MSDQQRGDGQQPGRLPRVDPTWPPGEDGQVVSEFAADLQGALSPFGAPITFPLPVESLGYQHPGPADRPNLPDA
ncbi:MAG: hypothetical protein ACR2JQ_06485 [Mycobacteriales bacterium]